MTVDEEDPNAFHNAIRETIGQGGDTDTNACIVGGMIGAYLGIQKLPEDMVSKVLNFDCENIEEAYDEDNEEMRNVGIQRPALFNQKARLAPSIKALVKLRARPNDKLQIIQELLPDF